ncbi:MAG: glycosyltransferase family 4 protein [Candidatus Altiarchaeota archaeon]|nr:glycosyltransferase family 4 protein [Candidatus Altiarchaeota archaeon]
MKILILSKTMPAHAMGGMENHTIELAMGLAKKKHKVAVITKKHPKNLKYERIGGVDIHYVDDETSIRKPLGPNAIEEFKKLNKKWKFDVIHSQSNAGYYFRFAVKDIPFVATMHGIASQEIISNINQGLTPSLIPKIIYHFINHTFYTKKMIAESDAVIAISDELAHLIPQKFSIANKKVHQVYNGIDTEEFKPMKRKNTEKVIFTVSTLHKQKGIQNLIKAMRDIKDSKLIIAGEGPYRQELEGLVCEMGLEKKVVFLGRVENMHLPKYYNRSSMFAIPTIRVEGLPLIELEAMSCGLAVVASDIGGIPTAINDGVNGLLVMPGDIEGLASAIERVLNDRKLAEKLGKNARATILKKFSREKMVEDTIKVYEKLT